MKLFVNEDGEIHDVGSTDNPKLTEVYVDETQPNFPFKDRSVEFICCYKIIVGENGIITMWTPYVASSALEHIDEQGKKDEDLMTAAKILLGEVEVSE